MVGNIGGRTAVANNDQIVESVSYGVYQAVRDAMSDSDNAPTVNVMLDGETLYAIANAGRCTLTIDRNGVPNIVSSFIPEISISANEEAEWSNVENILTNDPKDRYTLFYTNFISANDEHSILPPDEQSYSAHTGFISASISKEDRTFDINPIITIRQDVSATRSGLVIRFGQVIPSECNITTYSDGVQQEQFIIKPTEKFTRFNRLFLTFDTMNIIFVKTSDPFQPIDIEYIGFREAK